MYLRSEQPPIHMNSNTVSSKVWYSGTIRIQPFNYGVYDPTSVIDVDLMVQNQTGQKLIGFHVHDGEIVDSGLNQGFTNFGPIVYFLRTTPYWIRKKKEDPFPLAKDDVIPRSAFTLRGENDMF